MPRRELEQRAAGDDLAHVERQRRLRADRPAQRARVVGRVLGDVRLPLVGVDVDVVDERAGHLDVALRQAAARRELADLGDDDPAAVARGHGHGEHLALDGLALHRQVAVLVGGRAADHGDVDRERVEQQPLAAAQCDDLDEVLGRPAFCLPPVWRGSTYVPEPDVRHEARATGGDLAHQLREDALRERVRLELVGLDHGAEPRLVADVAADRPLHEPRQPELREAAVGEVADADDAHGRQVARLALRREDRRELVDEPLRQRMPGARTRRRRPCCRP